MKFDPNATVVTFDYSLKKTKKYKMEPNIIKLICFFYAYS